MPPEAQSTRIPVTLERVSVEANDPFDSFLALRSHLGERNVFLLESLAGPIADRRAAIVGFTPLTEITVTSGIVSVSGVEPLTSQLVKALEGAEVVRREGDLLVLPDSEAFWSLQRTLANTFDVPGAGSDSYGFGLFACYGYDAVRYIEHLPRTIAERADAPPDAIFVVYQGIAIFDLQSGTAELVVGQSGSWGHLDLQAISEVLSTAEHYPGTVPGVPEPASVSDSTTEAQFLKDTEKCLHHIAIGDIYQVQLGHELTIDTEVDPVAVYQRLRSRNPSPYMCYLPLTDFTIISGSPEVFVRVEGGEMTMRPIAGTTPRTGDAEEDERRVAALRVNEKEIAEHVMLVDLGRNDFSRVATTGSLEVTEMMVVEDYSHVFHLVSNITATAGDGIDAFDVVRATFPAGTVSGAPKIRAMEIIEDIETTRRGWYAGAYGLIGCGGYVNLGLCIRTLVHSGTIYRTRASAGIVADSKPEAEWRETLAKLSATYWAVTGQELL